MDLVQIKKNFDKNGYLWIKNFFKEDEVNTFCNALNDEDWIKKSKLPNSPEISSHKDLQNLLKHQKLIQILRTLTNNDLTYFGTGSVLGSNEKNSITWRRLHVDTRGNPNNPYGKTFYDPSKKTWPVINVFIYLEDFENYSGCLKVVEGSHKKFLPTIGNFIKVFFNIRKKTKFDGKYSFSSIPFLNLFKMKNIKSKPGDLFIFNHALHHSPNSAILKFFPNLVLPVLLENIFEKILPNIFKPKSKVRKMISIHYGKQSDELERYNISRKKYLNEEFIKDSRFFNDEKYRIELGELGLKSNINLKKYILEKNN